MKASQLLEILKPTSDCGIEIHINSDILVGIYIDVDQQKSKVSIVSDHEKIVQEQEEMNPNFVKRDSETMFNELNAHCSENPSVLDFDVCVSGYDGFSPKEPISVKEIEVNQEDYYIKVSA
jgi:hypothetical protein